MRNAELEKLSHWKSTLRRPTDRLGDEVVKLFTHNIEKRQKKFGTVGEAWIAIVPENLQTYAELSSLVRGTLTVIVDGSSRLYQLKQAMLAGLQDQLIHACRGAGLRKITLKAGKLSN